MLLYFTYYALNVFRTLIYPSSGAFERFQNFKYLGAILNADNNPQTHLQERIKNANETYFMLQNFFKNKNIQKVKINTKEYNNR